MACVLAASSLSGRPAGRLFSRCRCFGAVIPIAKGSQPCLAWMGGRAMLGSQHFQQGHVRDIKQMLHPACAQPGDLQSQLLAQRQVNSELTEMLTQSLEIAAAERSHLSDQIDNLYGSLHILTEQMQKESGGVRERVHRKGVKGRGGQSRMAFRPSIGDAEKQPTHVCEISHETLAALSMTGNHCAQRERLVREIMAVDGRSWESAHEILNKMDDHNEQYYWVESLPYRIGISCALIGGVMGTLMVFCKPVAVWYGENVAGEELPEGVKDISEMTTNQVGKWTWNWMEPMIGTASFVLLCCQFSRAQLKKINMKTYSEHLLHGRAQRLARRYPEYDSSMVKSWAKHMPRVNMNFFPVYEKYEGLKGPCSGL